MANEEHLAILKQGVEIWNQWRVEHSNVYPDLSRADLEGILAGEKREQSTRSGLVGAGKAIRVNLSGADLSKVKLDEANLQFVDLIGAQLAGSSCIRTNLAYANLSGADLGGADLREADLYQATLIRADLRKAILGDAKLREADLRRANLKGAELLGADLTRTNLNGANLSNANLVDARLREADLNDANFIQASVGRTTFGDVDLSIANGLDSLEHKGPSYIGIDTIYKSKGTIPESFLRGTGMPDNFIGYIHSLTGQALKYHSCFISYSSDDEDIAQRLYDDLQDNGVRCWFAPEDMKIGDPILTRIDESIRMHEKLLLILSENSVNSTWVEREVHMALAKEEQSRSHVLFPIRVDDRVMETEGGWPALVRSTRHIGDFTRWKDHDAYQQAFARLLRDLKAENKHN